MSRQSSLSLSEILAALPSAGACGGGIQQLGYAYPRGMLLNEIGEIYRSASAEAAQAEHELIRLLRANSEQARFIAWKYLSESPRPLSSAVRDELEQFIRDPANANLITR